MQGTWDCRVCTYLCCACAPQVDNAAQANSKHVLARPVHQIQVKVVLQPRRIQHLGCGHVKNGIILLDMCTASHDNFTGRQSQWHAGDVQAHTTSIYYLDGQFGDAAAGMLTGSGRHLQRGLCAEHWLIQRPCSAGPAPTSEAQHPLGWPARIHIGSATCLHSAESHTNMKSAASMSLIRLYHAEHLHGQRAQHMHARSTAALRRTEHAGLQSCSVELCRSRAALRQKDGRAAAPAAAARMGCCRSPGRPPCCMQQAASGPPTGEILRWAPCTSTCHCANKHASARSDAHKTGAQAYRVICSVAA